MKYLTLLFWILVCFSIVMSAIYLILLSEIRNSSNAVFVVFQVLMWFPMGCALVLFCFIS